MTILSAREAADALEASSTGCPSRFLSQVRVGFRWPPPPSTVIDDDRGNHHNNVEDEEHGAHPSRRFISALEKHPTVRVITFVNSTFGSGTGGRISVTDNNKADDSSNNDPVRARRPVDGDDDDDPMVDELFGTVLPCHGTLDSITFSRCVGITSSHLRSLLSPPSGPSSALRTLSLYDCPLDDPHLAAHATVGVLQSNGPLKDLHLIRCGLTSEGCRWIMDGASHSLHLRALSVVEPERLVVDSDTLAGVLGRRSRLQSLRVGARTWTTSGVEGLMRLLRTNDTLESLDLSGGDCDGGGVMHEPFRDVLSTYNFSLRYLLLPPGTAGNLTHADEDEDERCWRRRRNELDRVLDRNVRVTGYYRRLHDHGVPAIGSGRQRVKLWAESIGQLSSFPTLIYRFLRRNGNHHGVGLAEACLLHPPDRLRLLKRKGKDDSPVPNNRATRPRRVQNVSPDPLAHPNLRH